MSSAPKLAYERVRSLPPFSKTHLVEYEPGKPRNVYSKTTLCGKSALGWEQCYEQKGPISCKRCVAIVAARPPDDFVWVPQEGC